jgi:hypothetical protein
VDWRRLLLAIALASGTLTSSVAAQACTKAQETITGCINGDGVDVVGTIDTPGGDGTSGGPGGPGGTGTTGTSGPPVIWKCLEKTCSSDDEGAEPITLTDIASFRPRPGVQYMQPNGWMVPGLDANFYAVTSQHVVNGTLLGQPASVRFTPVAFHWNYGDGSGATRATKGGTWESLGIPEFGRTPTSHVYEEEGRYTIRLTIDFAAEYRFAGSPFFPIAGVLPVPANELHVTVDGAKTVLVEHDCAANPSGPGC